MRREFAFALIPFLPALLAIGQQPTPPTSPPDTHRTITVPIGYFTAPQLLPGAYDLDASHHCKKFDGAVLIGLIVDAQGSPQNIRLLRPTSTDLDKLAINVAAADRFTPGTRNGAPGAFAMQDEITLETCNETRKDHSGGNDALSLSLRSAPSQKLDILSPLPPSAEPPQAAPAPGVYIPGGRISAPVPIHLVTAQFSDEARRAHYQGVCTIGLIVDEQGNPQNVHIVRTLGMGLDEKAMEAVRQYKFKPGLKDGKTPVPVLITVEVDFHL
jgi:TonB family protein